MSTWLAPPRPATPEAITDPAQRRMVRIELLIVFTVTLGLSGARSLLSLIDDYLKPVPLHDQAVAINVPQASLSLIDFAKQLLGVAQLVAWGALGVYLLWRAGFRLAEVGLVRHRGDLLAGVGLAAVIGTPGLAFYLVSYHLGASLAVLPSTLDTTWWTTPVLILSAAGNAFAEEALVVGYLITRLRQLDLRENTSLLSAAVLRGSYHLYQGLGGFAGNLVMGLVFGRVWQRTNRLWPLIIAHTLMDTIVFVGYPLLRGRVSWLP